MLTGAKRVETVHNVYDWFTWWQRHCYAAYCLLAHRIIAVSEIVRQFTVQHFPLIREGKVIVIHNGIDVDRFHNEAGSEQLRSELGLSGSEVVIGFVGRLEEQKGITYLLDAAHRLNEQYNNFTLIILGDGSLASALRDKAVALHLSNTLFLGFRADAARYFSAFDIYALPSLYEGLPLSVLEAMASECPVVATRVGGVPEVVKDGVTGFLVAPKKVDELVDRLQKLIQNEEMRLRMGKAGRQRVVQHFSAASMVAKTEEVYEVLLGKSHSR
jgi:glycosyltransferase involved in cell wall biosynthesis